MNRILLISLIFIFILNVHGQKNPIDWLNQNSIDFVDNRIVPTAELDKIFKDKHVVGIGESTHGTHEFQLLKSELFKYLVYNHDFKVFAIEDNFGDLTRINDYINGSAGNLRKLMGDFNFWTWKTAEMYDLIEWMREYNLSVADSMKIHFYGFDIQYGKAYVRSIKKYLTESNSILLDSIQHDLDCIPNNRRDFDKLDLQTKESINKTLEVLSNDIFNSKDTYEKKIGTYNYKLFQINMDGLTAFINHNEVTRDKLMADLVTRIYELENSKVMVWAHNGHIAKGKVSYNSPLSCGYYLKERFENEYYSIGFGFYKGTFKAVNMEKGTIEEYYVENSLKKSLGKKLSAVEHSTFFIDVNHCKANKKLSKMFNNNLLVRNIGAVFNPKYGYFGEYKLADTFDGFIFVNETSPTIFNE